jgi:hypothetical protein
LNQWTHGYCLPKKAEGRNSRETVPLNGSNMNQKYMAVNSIKMAGIQAWLRPKKKLSGGDATKWRENFSRINLLQILSISGVCEKISALSIQPLIQKRINELNHIWFNVVFFKHSKKYFAQSLYLNFKMLQSAKLLLKNF